MELIKKLREKHIYDIAAILTLLTVFVILAVIFVSRQGHPLIDCFAQGAYIPSEMLKGKILYKDIMISYGPFSYQLNALLFMIFGEHLNTIYSAGVINSFIIVLTLFLIARNIFSIYTAFTVSFLIITTCVFHYYIFNYIFPYTYAISYALSAFLLSLLFCIYYLKTSRPVFIPFAYFFIGVSILSKLDYSMFLVILLIITLILKPVSKKYILTSFIAMITLPLICWSILFLQGLNINDLTILVKYMNDLVNSPLMQNFYSNYTGLYPSERFLRDDLSFFLKFFSIFIISVMLIYPLMFLTNNSSRIKFKFPKIAPVIAGIIFTCVIPFLYFRYSFFDGIWVWTAISSTLLLLFVLFYNLICNQNNLKKSSFVEKLKNISSKDRIFLLIAFVSLIGASRSYFYIDLHSFGTFLLPLILLINVGFFIDYIPDYLEFIDSVPWKQACSIVLITLGVTISIKYMYIARAGYIFPVSTEKGSFYTLKMFADPLNQTIDYINKNMTPEESFIMIPRGPILNFLTEHSSDTRYYNLEPSNILVLNEDKIVKDLGKNPPDYILINNFSTADWGFPYFGRDYGFKINRFRSKNYKFEKMVGNKEFWIAIFRKKDGI